MINRTTWEYFKSLRPEEAFKGKMFDRLTKNQIKKSVLWPLIFKQLQTVRMYTTFTCIESVISQNQGMLWIGKHLKYHLVPLPAVFHLPLDQVATSPVQPSLPFKQSDSYQEYFKFTHIE